MHLGITYLKTPHSFPCHGLSQTQSAAELLHRPFKLQSRSEVQADAIDADVQMETAESSSRACIIVKLCRKLMWEKKNKKKTSDCNDELSTCTMRGWIHANWSGAFA